MTKFRAHILVLLAVLCTGGARAQQVATIPLVEQRMPADDLFYQGRVLRSDEAFQLSQGGLDLATLSPPESAVWGPAKRAVLENDDDLPIASGDTSEYAGPLASAAGLLRFNVRHASGYGIVHLDKTLHTMLLRKNILRLLGYKVPAMKWLRRLDVRFETLDEMNNFLRSQIPRATLGAAERWVEEKDEAGLRLRLRDVVVTVPASADHYNFSMGVPPRMLTSRSMRALIVPYGLLDLGESANKFEWTVGRVSDNQIMLPHFTRGNFATTMDDARWMMGRLSALTREEIAQAVDGARFPPEVARLVLEKVLSRRNALVRLFRTQAAELPVEARPTQAPHLERGRLTRTDWPGYASRFAHGDPESPFKDMHWYVLAKLQAVGIDNLIARANRELVAFNPNEVRAQFHRDQFQRGLNHFVETGYFLEFPVSTWFSPVGDVNLIASRDVVVGNYLGTDNLVQLADSLGWELQLGGHLGIENWWVAPTASIRGTVTWGKTWTHLKPLRSLKNVFKEPYRNIMVPLIKWQLGKELLRLHTLGASANGTVDWDLEKDDSALSQLISHLNDHLGVGESLIYTERLNPVASGAVEASLMGSPVRLRLSAGVNEVDVRRVQIFRKDTKTFQVYDDHGDGRGWSLDVSLEQLIPVVRLGLRRQRGDFRIRMHEVNLDPDVETNPRLFDQAHALGQFIQTGSSELLQTVAPAHTVDAEYIDRSSRLALLAWRRKTLRTDTVYDIRSSEGLEGRFVALSDDSQTGWNWEAFAKDVVNYGLQRLSAGVSWAPPVFQNPAQTIMGMGNTKEGRYEALLEGERHQERFIRLTDRWEGWSTRVRDVQARMRQTNERFGARVFDERSLQNASGLKLFDVAVNINLYEAGVRRLEELQPLSLVALEQRLENASGVNRRGCDDKPIRQRALGDGRSTQSCGTLQAQIIRLNSCVALDRENASANARAKCRLGLFRSLFERLRHEQLAGLVGQDNMFVYGSVNGFREGDEVLNDPIPSDTLGRIGGRNWNGPFDRLQQMLGIQGGEMNGYWLREQL